MKLYDVRSATRPIALPLVALQAAAGWPRVSRDGRTYTFTVRRGFRFYPSRKALTAADFAWVLYRDVAGPDGQPPATEFSPGRELLREVVGVQSVLKGRGPAALGVHARGMILTVRLTRPVPTFVARLASPYFCALPRGTPSPPERGIPAPVPSAGPYYIASGGPDSEMLLKRNPLYPGPRPHFAEIASVPWLPISALGDSRVDVIHLRRFADLAVAGGAPPGARLLVRVRPQLFYLALNQGRPLFHDNPQLAHAVAFAIDRRALARAYSRYSGRATDRLLPFDAIGPRRGSVYSLAQPDLDRARALAAGHLRDRTAVVRSCDVAQNALIEEAARELAAIGLQTEVVERPCWGLVPRLDEADVVLGYWSPRGQWPYSEVAELDPALALRLLVRDDPFYLGFAPPVPNFDDPRWLSAIDRLSQLRSTERAHAAGQLEATLLRAGIPIVPVMNTYDLVLLSRRVGCVSYDPEYWVDLARLCAR